MNGMDKPTVRHWRTRNDVNHDNRHAECLGIEFLAFPYQPYSGRGPKGVAIISDILIKGNVGVIKIWSVRAGPVLPNGENIWSHFKRFGDPNEMRDATEEERDDAFRWAAERIIQ